MNDEEEHSDHKEGSNGGIKESKDAACGNAHNAGSGRKIGRAAWRSRGHVLSTSREPIGKTKLTFAI
jgi:hypothetical protein